MINRLLVVCCMALAAHSESIPVTDGVSLAGQTIQLPSALSSRQTILIVGFTQKSGEPCNLWKKKACVTGSAAGCYQIALLASVPRLLRGVVVRSIKKDMAVQEQTSFLPIFEREKEWKAVAGFAEPDDAYVFVVSRQGEVEWKTHGSVTPDRLAKLLQAVK